MPSSAANIIAVATGNILPYTFAQWTVDGAVQLGVEQADGTLPIAGIATEAPNDALTPTYAATSGQQIMLYASEFDDCYLKLGGNVSSNQLLKSDGSGFGVVVDYTSTSKQFVGARAMMTGVSGDVIRVKPHIEECGPFSLT